MKKNINCTHNCLCFISCDYFLMVISNLRLKLSSIFVMTSPGRPPGPSWPISGPRPTLWESLQYITQDHIAKPALSLLILHGPLCIYDECLRPCHYNKFHFLLLQFFLSLLISVSPFVQISQGPPFTHFCSTIPKPCLSEPLFDKGCAEIPWAFLIRLPPIVTMFTVHGGQRAWVSTEKAIMLSLDVLYFLF